jgi:hypothetical protein
MTADLASVCSVKQPKVLNSWDFIDAVALKVVSG